ncbi:MAG: YigZ family protein [Planctomycetota bacterium]
MAVRIRHEPAKVKGSRHIATVAPIADEDDVAALVEAARAEFPTARHHAFAWRLGVDGARFRSSDDGEPSGSAGKPILAQIDRLDLTRTAVVVSRIFGGTKLGVGGLVRAYGGAAAEALERAGIVTCILTAAVTIEHAYEHSGPIQGLLHRRRLTPRDAEYGEKTRFVVDVPVDDVDGFLREVGDATAGRAACTVEMPDVD